MLKIIIIIVLILILGYLFFLKSKKEKMETCQSDCGFNDLNCDIETCLKQSKGQEMDVFRKCMQDKNVPEKIIKNFSPVQFALLLNNLDCERLEKAIEKANQ
jgi:hypothetical protein